MTDEQIRDAMVRERIKPHRAELYVSRFSALPTLRAALVRVLTDPVALPQLSIRGVRLADVVKGQGYRPLPALLILLVLAEDEAKGRKLLAMRRDTYRGQPT